MRLRPLSLSALALAALLSACGGSSDPAPSPGGEPNDTLAQATPLTIGTPVVATISTATTPAVTGDLDFYWFTVPAGGATVRFQTFDQGGVACDPVGQTVDTYVFLYDGTGTLVGGSDDSFLPWCEDFTFPMVAGKNYVMVGGYQPTPFTYTLKVTIP